MADETQPTQSTSSQSRRPVRVTATGSDPHLLSLPDNVFHKLFEYLSWESGTAGVDSADAFSLAATCRELNNCYRFSFVVALRLCIGPRSPSDVLFRALERLPRVESIDLGPLPTSGDSLEIGSEMPEPCLRVLRKTASMHKSRSSQSRALDIRSLFVGNLESYFVYHSEVVPTVATECVRSAVETFSSLELLYMDVYLYQGGDDAITAIVETLSNSLRTLRLRYFTEPSNVGSPRIRELHCLRKLQLHVCHDEITFDAVGMLEELVELSLQSCAISDAAACRLVGRLRKLTTLHLSSCRNVSCNIFRFLPQSLVEFTIFDVVVNDFDRAPCIELEGVPNLTSIKACGLGVSDLSFLRPFAPRLRVLHLSLTNVSDADMAHWIRQMPNLETLSLSGTEVSDETARAVSSLGKISEADLDLTKISIDGVRALTGGVACQSLTWLCLKNCPSISMEDVAVEELDRMVVGNRKRNGMVCRLDGSAYGSEWSE